MLFISDATPWLRTPTHTACLVTVTRPYTGVCAPCHLLPTAGRDLLPVLCCQITHDTNNNSFANNVRMPSVG